MVRDFFVAVSAAVMLAVALPSTAFAEWDAEVKSIGFGERAASARISGEGSGLAFMCESSAKPISLRITTRVRVEAYEPDLKGKIQLSIDNGDTHDFEAAIGKSLAATRLVNAQLTSEDAKKAADILGSAKRTIAFRVVGPNGTTTLSSVVSASGSRRAISRVLEACTAPTVAPPSAPSRAVEKPKIETPPQGNTTQTSAPVAPATPVVTNVPVAAPVAARDVADLAELTLTPELIGQIVKITVGCMSGTSGVLLRDRTGGLVPVVDTGLSTEDQITMRRHCAPFTNKIEVVGTLQRPGGRSFYKHEVKASSVTFK